MQVQLVMLLLQLRDALLQGLDMPGRAGFDVQGHILIEQISLATGITES